MRPRKPRIHTEDAGRRGLGSNLPLAGVPRAAGWRRQPTRPLPRPLVNTRPSHDAGWNVAHRSYGGFAREKPAGPARSGHPRPRADTAHCPGFHPRHAPLGAHARRFRGSHQAAGRGATGAGGLPPEAAGNSAIIVKPRCPNDMTTFALPSARDPSAGRPRRRRGTGGHPPAAWPPPGAAAAPQEAGTGVVGSDTTVTGGALTSSSNSPALPPPGMPPSVP